MKDNQIRIMPDTHAGKGCVVGTTMTIKDKIVPNLVGCDIGCGMSAIKLKEKEINYTELDEIIHKYVQRECNIHNEIKQNFNELNNIIAPININNALKSIGTLGGGNHFIECDKDNEENLWLVIHTGSRHLGIEVCEYYQNLAYERLKEKENGGSLKDKNSSLMKEHKKQGRQKEIQTALKKLANDYIKNKPRIPKELACLEGNDMQNYLHDMSIVQKYAKKNREIIADSIIKNMRLTVIENFDTIHNYIDIDNMILRKGSISAQNGEKVIIPMNMRDGSLICIGKGNPDWNYSAPHGAGRILSRSKAKQVIDFNDFKETEELPEGAKTADFTNEQFIYHKLGKNADEKTMEAAVSSEIKRLREIQKKIKRNMDAAVRKSSQPDNAVEKRNVTDSVTNRIPDTIEDGIVNYFDSLDEKARELINNAIENNMPDIFIRQMFTMDYKSMKEFYEEYFK